MPPESFRPFMENIIDYAGLFPPAKLEMNSAVNEYLRCRSDNHSWILGRFVCPVHGLKELESSCQKFSDNSPVQVSVITSPIKTDMDFQDTFFCDLEAIKEFIENSDGKATVEIIEIKLSTKFLDSDNSIGFRQMLEEADHLIGNSGIKGVTLYFEILFSANCRKQAKKIIQECSAFNRELLGAKRVGFKIRCGGEHSFLVPETADVAFAISACRDAKIPFKATAGLHHPIRHLNPHTKAASHGFLNLFAAGILAWVHGLSDAKIVSVLEDQCSENFVFSNETFRWKNLKASVQEIATAREDLMTSYGSCSFQEPVNDLTQLGLL